MKRLAGLAAAAVCCLGLVYLTGSAGAQTVPGAPTVASVTAGAGSLTVTWTAPVSDGGSPVVSYDVRHIETGAVDRTDGNWTVEEGVWTSGDLSHTVTRLTDGVAYDIGVRAANTTDPGAWSATASGTTRDHPDRQSAATPLTLDSSLPGRIDPVDDEDLFKIVITEDTDLWVYTTGDLDTVGELTDSRGDVVDSNDEGRLPPAPFNFSLRAEVEAGTYYVSVRIYVGAHTYGGTDTGAYRVHAVNVLPVSTDPGEGTLISPDSLTPGRLERPPDPIDVFRIELTEHTDLSVFSISDSPTAGTLYDADGDEVISFDENYVPGRRPGFRFRARLEPGTYRIHVTGHEWDDARPYLLYVDAVDDPGSSIATAVPLTFELEAPGRIEPAGDQDYFSLTLAAPSNVWLFGLSYHNDRLSLDVALFDEDGNEGHLNVFAGNDLLTAKARLGAGTHYFRITSRDGRPRPYMLFPRVDVEANRFDEDCLMRGSSQSDPLYGCQWYLNNTGQYPGGAGHDINVEGVWATTMGEGVNVAVVDQGMDFGHEDLKDNISEAGSHDYGPDNPWDPEREFHGTAVAGLIAAADNIVGGRGVAPRATLYGRRRHTNTVAETADAMIRDMSEVAVSNNSWGPPDNGQVWFASRGWEMAVERGVKEGYDGKGIFYVWAGGNGHPFDNSNFDGLTSHYAVTAVCAVDHDDDRAIYSERGANLWVCAPSSGDSDDPEVTTTRNTNLSATRYTKYFGGTSAAAPMVSGVAALLRSVYPALTWRDLKLILAGSARHNDPSDSGWEQGALRYDSADEHYRFNHNYGFGVVDAGAAMELADGWTSPPPWREVSATSDETAEITDRSTVTTRLVLDPYVEFVEFIAIEPTISHTYYRDLHMELTSPSGVTSVLSVAAPVRLVDAEEWVELTPRFGSAKHLGEDAAGEWTLSVTDKIRVDEGTLHSWKLTAYGHGYIPGFPGIRVTVSGDGTITVLWEAPGGVPVDIGGSAITGYDLRYVPRDADGGADPSGWTVVEGVWSAGSLQHTLSDLDTGARYYVGVRAVNGAGAGPWSESFPAATEAEAPGAPQITGVVSGNKAVTVSWAASDDDGAADITAYDLRYIETSADETVEGGWTVTEDVWTSRDGGAYEYELGGLETDVGYDVEIRAVNRVGDGAWSATAMQAPREVPGAPAVGSVTAGRQALTVGWVTPQVTGGSAIKSYDVRHILSDAADKDTANWTVESSVWAPGSGDLEYTYTITGLEGGAGYDVGVRAINSVGDGSWSDTVTGTTSLSDDATLSALAGVRLKPAFDSGTMSYTATVGYTVTRVTVRATSNYHRATVDFLDGDGNPLADADSAAPGHQVDLSVGNYIVGVKVTAQDGVTTLTYTVTVTREDEDLTLTPAASNPVAPFPSEVSYFLRFTGYWTDRDTPEGVPSGAGFSPLIGAVHNAAAVFLRSGGRASPGVEEMAETGNQSTLIDDFREEFDAGNVSLVIKGNRQIVHISSAAFDAIPMSTDHPLVTLVTRLTPSHDWFTGVSGLSLLDASGRWRRTHGVDIFPWDAGTEQGNDFSSSPDDETIPQGLITSISGVGPFTTDRIARLEFILKTVTTERTVAENTPEGGNIGLPVTPFTTSGTVNYTLGGPDKDSFDLDNSTGQLRAKPGVTYDRERRPSYTVTITYNDTHGDDVVTTVNIEVRDVDEAPTISGDATVDYPENGTTPVGTYTASDPEGEDVTRLSLSGADDEYFELSDAGRLTFKSPPDYETKNSYNVTLSTSDGNFTGTLDVVVTVTDVNETPAVSGREEVEYVENGTDPVAGYSADDPENDDITWSLAGTDARDFEISDSGVLTFRQTPNHESPVDSNGDNVYLVTVQASDGRRTGTLDVTVTVTDLDEPPVISGPGSVRYQENDTKEVGTYAASDPEHETVTLSLVGMDEEALELSATGVLTFGEVPDRENPADLNRDNVYEVTVRAEDGTNTADFGVTITVTNVDEAPVISVVIVGGVIDPVSGEVSRDYAEEGLTDPVGLFFASDPEESPVTLLLVGTDAGNFALSGSGPSGSCVSGSCELGFGGLPDFESPADSGRDNVYEVTVRAGDGTNYGTRDVVVTVTNVDEDGTVSLSSVQPQVGTELGAVLSDPDGSVTAVTWVWERSLSSAAGWSMIVGVASDVYTPVDGDENFFLRVMASYSDGQGSGKTAGAVSANRVQEAPREPNTAPYFPSSETGRREVDENTLTGREFGEAVAAIDDNVGDTLTYRLEGGDAASFRIGESSGRLLTEAVLDYEKKRSYSMMLTVTDTSGETDSIRVRVMVIDVDEPPDLSGPVAVDYAENRRDTVASYTADDPEGARIEWTLAGADPDDFAISRGGVLTFGSPPDYEAPTGSGGDNTYSVTVQASDGTYTPTPSRTVTVSVTNQEEKGTVTLTPARPDVDVPVSAVLVDPDRGVSNRVWRWERSQNNRDWTPIPGAVEDSYTPTTADRGHYLRVVVTYDDAEGPTKDATAATAGRVPNPTRPPPPPPPSPPPSPPPGPSSGPGPGPSGGGPEPLPPGANHPPEFDEGSRTVRTVAENSPPGTSIGGPVTATDPEDDPLAYKLAGTAADTFDLDTATGQIKTKAALDYESRNSYTISVEVRDGKNPEGEPDRRRDDSIRVTINIVNRNDPGWVTPSAPTPRVDQPLQAALTDPDGHIADLNWRWERSTDQNSWTPIPDTDGASYTAAAGDEGHYLRVTATYSDPFGPGQAATAAPPNPVTVGHTTAFTDIDTEGVHAPAIAALATDGIFVDTGCGDGLFCPDQPIQRQTMAIWLIRILGGDPPTVGDSRFADIAHGQWWIRYAEALADRNITLGCATNPPRYCPDRSVTRAQMASFLTRALQLPEAQTPAGFTDTQGNTHQANIDALAAAGITLGCDTDPLQYCPDQPVTRAQMATFLHRALNHQNQRPPTTNT